MVVWCGDEEASFRGEIILFFFCGWSLFVGVKSKRSTRAVCGCKRRKCLSLWSPVCVYVCICIDVVVWLKRMQEYIVVWSCGDDILPPLLLRCRF